MLEAKSIARRMFVTNSFDGLLSSLGIILGAYIAGLRDPAAYVGTVVGASFSMGVFSGIIATYFSERAERMRELRMLEKQLLHDLKGSVYEKAVKFVPLYVALWSGLGVVLLPALGVTPFIVLPLIGGAPVWLMVYSSVALILLEIFLLGVYLGRVAGESPVRNGLKLLGIGGLAAAVLTLVELLT
jgi:predicted membrane protein (TIGR00267 family)